MKDTRINIINQQRRFRLNRVAVRRMMATLAAIAASTRRSAPPWREVTVIITDDAGIEPFNRAIMKHAGTTDVITQRYDALPGEPVGLLGEVIVNVERAWQVGGARRGWSAAHELALYLAHGCDHLNDEEDTTPAGRQRMRRREMRWLRRLDVPVLFKPAARASF